MPVDVSNGLHRIALVVRLIGDIWAIFIAVVAVGVWIYLLATDPGGFRKLTWDGALGMVASAAALSLLPCAAAHLLAWIIDGFAGERDA